MYARITGIVMVVGLMLGFATAGSTQAQATVAQTKMVTATSKKVTKLSAYQKLAKIKKTNKKIAKKLVKQRKWSNKQYVCLVKLWNKESNWNHKAHNVRSGAYGIPQALPGNKMNTAGKNWRTSAKTQIKWGLSYIKGRYDTPCKALNAHAKKGWY